MGASQVAYCLHLMHAGIAFCGVTAATLLGIGTDNLVIAHICRSSAVAKYDVVNKVSSLTLFIGYSAAPLWPAFSEAQTRNDAIWLRSAFRHTTILAASIAAAICLSLLLVGRNIVRLWVGPALVPSFSFLAGFCCYRFLAGASEAAVPLLNTAPLLKTHLLIASVSAIVAVCSKIIAAKYAGIEGVIWATAAAMHCSFMPQRSSLPIAGPHSSNVGVHVRLQLGLARTAPDVWRCAPSLPNPFCFHERCSEASSIRLMPSGVLSCVSVS